MELLPAARPFSPASHFNEWLYEAIQPWLKGRVLEVNSGLDTLSSTFLQRERKILLNSTDKEMRHQLRAKYEGLIGSELVNRLDFRRRDFEDAYLDKYRIFDTILLLNSVENGSLDQALIRHAKHLLRERGRLIFLAPVRTALFYGLDDNEEECKKYNRKDTHRILTADMEILSSRYVILQLGAGYRQSGLSVLAITRKIN
jgi:SAM-dependent methyltransferase